MFSDFCVRLFGAAARMWSWKFLLMPSSSFACLAFHLPWHPRTLSLNYHGRPNQYGLWPRFTERAKRGDKLILIVDDLGAGADPLITALTPHFEDVNTGLPVTLVRGGDVVKYLRMWELAGWRGTWPQSPLRSRP